MDDAESFVDGSGGLDAETGDENAALSRRSVLKGLGALAAGTAIAACTPGGSGTSRTLVTPPTRLARLMSSTTNVVREPGSLPNPKLPAGTDTLAQIEHIVVPMIENHSYDDHLGMLRRSNGCKLVRNGLALDANPYTQGKLLKAFQMPWTCQLRGTPSQAWDASPAAYDNGRDDGFVTGSGPAAMGYWDSTDIACYCGLAQTFRVADRWFCSVVAHTHPNRRFLIAGTAAGIVSTSTASLLAPTGAVVPPSEPCTRCVGVS